MSTRTCLRCEREVKVAAIVIGEGAVCKSCRPYVPPFIELKSPENHETCTKCGRFRSVETRDPSGDPICKKCMIDPNNPGIQHQISEDYWHRMAARQWRLGEEAFESSWCRNLFEGFAVWADGRISAQWLALNVADVRDRFLKIEAAFSSREEITADRLLNIFGAEGVRRLGRVIPYLHAQGVQVPSRASSLRAAEMDRISRSLLEMEDSPHYSLLTDYAAHLECPRPKGHALKSRTKRYYLKAATELLRTAGHARLEGKIVEKMLRETPGHAASLGRFIGFLNKRFNYHLPRPNVRRASNSKQRKKRGVTALQEVMEVLSQEPPEALRKSLTAGMLVGISAVPLEEVLAMRRGDVKSVDNLVRVRMLGEWGTLPTPCSRALGKYLALVIPDAHASDPLFPGRPDYNPLCASSASYHLKKLNVSVTELKSDAGSIIVAATEPGK